MHVAIKILIGVGIATVLIAIVVIPVGVTVASVSSSNSTSSTSGGSSSSGVLLYGMRKNLISSSLGNSWTLCYSRTYSTLMSSSTLLTTLATCNKSRLLLGCRAIGSSNLLVAAMGDRSDVLYNCGVTSSCKRVANGVSWYYSNMLSWGFASGTDTVNRNPCDISTTNPSERMCWITTNNGGYRCGSVTGLQTST
ncbi:unnamed protein product [Adineta ricciae]|uniref:Uncharacterized protein n=1 Tax=Adineta ricciae TaxID=249248 RepID=A0A814V5I1_ADIRI|nr:unnamed protein product [Adineta ricciae]CAF1258108.1 unnamed protein product [Adineta ricciae]